MTDTLRAAKVRPMRSASAVPTPAKAIDMEALKVLLETIEVKTAEELVGTRKIDGEIVKDMLMGVTDRILYNGKGEPGLDRFYMALS